MSGLLLKKIILTLVLILFGGSICLGRGLKDVRDSSTIVKSRESMALFTTSEPTSNIAVHNAGDLYSPFIYDRFSTMGSNVIDPETGLEVVGTTYPKGSGKRYLYVGSIWVGGIVGDDTLVSIGSDGWSLPYGEFWPPDLYGYSTMRTGNFADDEFETIVVDTFVGSSWDYPQHRPMGIKVTRKTYSWADSLYDDFIILEYQIENIGEKYIEDAWVGIFFDTDIYHGSEDFGWVDDMSGSLDTLLYVNDPNSHVLIPYACDIDGDPSGDNSQWLETSVRGALSLRLLETSFELSRQNFNWWIPNSNSILDFGPRQIGTAENPYRPYSGGYLGHPRTDEDRYHMLSYPEIDYDQMELVIHDSTDGWIPWDFSGPIDFTHGWDTRFLLSFGSFNLASGQVESITIAMVAGDNIHVNPSDFRDKFDVLNPDVFYNSLDFSELLLHHRRADSVWKSGYLLPNPGPPIGLKIDSYTAEQVSMVWNPSHRPDLDGYFLIYKDSLVDDDWHRFTPEPITDTTIAFPVFDRSHNYQFAVSLVDNSNRESALSDSISIIPATPHTITGLASRIIDNTVPEISWDAPVDTMIVMFRIYRAFWGEDYLLHDSTSENYYLDYETESGGYYRYLVSAINDLGMESEKVGPVLASPMAMDQGVMFINYNRNSGANYIAYDPSYLDALYESIASMTKLSRRNWATTQVVFKDLADYEVVIVDMESRHSLIRDSYMEFYELYMKQGGKVIFITRAIGFGDDYRSSITRKYSPGDFYYDFLKLDSSVYNPMIYIVTDTIYFPGDLTGCESENSDYPDLKADTIKLRNCYWPAEEYIQMAGFLYPREEAEILYRYQSSNTDTINHEQVNGIRYLGDDYQFVLLNFQLSMMTEDDSFHALYQALYDLGVSVNCGDVDGSGSTNLSDIMILIRHLYYEEPEHLPAPDNADVDCDHNINLADAIQLINFTFKNGMLNCCTD